MRITRIRYILVLKLVDLEVPLIEDILVMHPAVSHGRSYHGGGDLRLRGSLDTDHGVIAVNAKDYVVYSRGLSTPVWLLVLNA